jgi:hypothetical protein
MKKELLAFKLNHEISRKENLIDFKKIGIKKKKIKIYLRGILTLK